jgi:hypothetical protein
MSIDDTVFWDSIATMLRVRHGLRRRRRRRELL